MLSIFPTQTLSPDGYIWCLDIFPWRFPMPSTLSSAFGRGFRDIGAVIGKRSWQMEQQSGRSSTRKGLLGYALVPIDESPASANNPKHVVVVMDGMKGFTMAPLEWALENLIGDNCTVTLLGVMPWLNISLSSKIWLDVWPVEIDNLSNLQERNEWHSDVRYLKLQAIIDLCQKYGVVPQKEVVMGYPTKLLVVEKITSLHATWVVFDKHQRKNREFYVERIPCNMVMMNENGEGDMIKGRCVFNSIDRLSTTGESPASSSLAPTPQVLISEELREIIREKIKEKEAVSVSAS